MTFGLMMFISIPAWAAIPLIQDGKKKRGDTFLRPVRCGDCARGDVLPESEGEVSFTLKCQRPVSSVISRSRPLDGSSALLWSVSSPQMGMCLFEWLSRAMAFITICFARLILIVKHYCTRSEEASVDQSQVDYFVKTIE